VIALISKTDSRAELNNKMLAYQANGARLGWLIDPRTKTVTVYRSGENPEVLQNPAELSGEAVLLGLVLNLTGIF
jgi:Uma2 family endonuclease